MGWGLTIVVAILTAIAACLVAGTVAGFSVEWYSVSSREGAAGYFVVGIALLGAIAGFVIGMIAARYVAGHPNPGFLKASGLSLGVVGAVGLLSAWTARSLADIDPTIDGQPLNLVVEFRWPAGAAPPSALAGDRRLDLGSVSGMSRIQRTSRDGALWTQDAHQVDGRWVVPGAVPLFTRRGKRMVVVQVGDSAFEGFMVPIPGNPGKKYLEWSEWLPKYFRGKDPWPDDRISYRFKVQPRTVPVRTETIGPFGISTLAYWFERETIDSVDRITISGEFLLSYRGQPLVLAAPAPGEGIPTGTFEKADEIAVVGGSTPALLVHVSDAQEPGHHVFLVVGDGDQPRIEYVGETGYGIEGEPLTSDAARYRAARTRKLVKGVVDRASYAEPGLYLISRSVVDTRNLTVRRIRARAAGSAPADVGPLAVSPDGRSFAEFAWPDHSSATPALAVTDAVADSVYLVPVDPLRMRYANLEVLDPAWLAHHFTWTRDGDGIDRLVERPGFVPIPYHGTFDKYTDGSLNFRLEPVSRALREALVELLVKEFQGERIAADSSDYQFPVRIEGKRVQVAASYDFGYVSVSMDAKDADPALFARVTKAVDAALATGKYDHYFVKPTS